MTTALEANGSDKALDLGSEIHIRINSQNDNRDLRLGVRLSIGLLRALHFSPNNILPNIVFLAQVEEFPDLRCSFGTQPLGQNDISQPWDLLISLLHDNERKNGNVGADDAATD